MAFKFALITLVYPTPANDEPCPNAALLRKANAWLQRCNAGCQDDLLVIGVGFINETELEAAVKPYGLGKAQLKVIQLETDDELGECIQPVAQRWIAERHEATIPMLDWTQIAGDTAYPKVGWWWCGVEAATDEQTALAEILGTVGPDSFRRQAMTWAAILTDHLGNESSEDETENYEASIMALTLAYWLTGFDAATENSFFDFSAGTAFDASGLDRLRVGFEAGRSHQAKASCLAECLDFCDDDFSDSCLIACLDLRISEVRESLSKTFGGDATLFWSLYSSIFPNLKVPMREAMDDLLGLRSVEMAEIDRPWRFVTEGWIDVEE